MSTKLLLATAAIVVLAGSAAITGPRLAQASFDPAAPSCTLGNVDVNATAATHSYSYDLNCGVSGNYHADGSYDVGTQRASEKITNNGGPSYQIEASWNCPADPWGSEPTPVCTVGAVETSSNDSPFSYWFDDGTLRNTPNLDPFSFMPLDSYSRHVLAAQLQNALNAHPLQAPAPPAPVNPATQLANGRTTTAVVGSLPKPDLVAVGINGPTTVFSGMDQTYTATVRNDGADVNGQVEVLISFFDPFENLDGAAISAPGFDCSSYTAYTLDCRGGSLAQGQSVAIVFAAHATQPGDAKLLVNVNPNNTVAESNSDNNTAVLDVTVQ